MKTVRIIFGNNEITCMPESVVISKKEETCPQDYLRGAIDLLDHYLQEGKEKESKHIGEWFAKGYEEAKNNPGSQFPVNCPKPDKICEEYRRAWICGWFEGIRVAIKQED